MKKNRVLSVILFWLYISTCSHLQAALKVTTFQLANGLNVILSPMENMEAACVMMVHMTGVRDDPPEIRGASYLYETLMQGGTQELDPMEREVLIKRVGGISVGRINYDYSIFSMVVPDSELRNALWLESQRLTSLHLELDKISLLKEIIYKRYFQLTNTNLYFSAANSVKSAVLEGTVYQNPLYGDLDSIRDFPNQKIVKLYDNYRDLSNTILVISGKFNTDEARQVIDNLFSNITFKKTVKKKDYASILPRTSYLDKTMPVENIQQPFIIYGIRTPGKLNRPDRIYFDFLRYYLLDPRISRLEKLLNEKSNSVIHISYETSDFFEANFLLIKIAAGRNLDIERSRYIINKELDSFRGKGRELSGGELKMVKSLMELDFRKDMRDLEKRCLLLAENYYLHGEDNFFENDLQRISKITLYDISKTGRKYLSKGNMVVLSVSKK